MAIYMTLEEAIRLVPVPHCRIKVEDVIKMDKNKINDNYNVCTGSDYDLKDYWNCLCNLHIASELVGADKLPFRDRCGSTPGYFGKLILEKSKERIENRKKAAKKKEIVQSPVNWSDERLIVIPTIGTMLELTEDWEFRLHSESRNKEVMELFGMSFNFSDPKKFMEVVFPKGTVLRVSRIYIKQGCSSYDSMTFNIYHAPEDLILIDALSGNKMALKSQKTKAKKKPRFWAKLSDVNKMKAKINLETLSKN